MVSPCLNGPAPWWVTGGRIGIMQHAQLVKLSLFGSPLCRQSRTRKACPIAGKGLHLSDHLRSFIMVAHMMPQWRNQVFAVSLQFLSLLGSILMVLRFPCDDINHKMNVITHMQVNYPYTHSKCNHCFFGFDVRFKSFSQIFSGLCSS